MKVRNVRREGLDRGVHLGPLRLCVRGRLLLHPVIGIRMTLLSLPVMDGRIN